MTPVRVLVCDDQEVVREGMRAILGVSPEVEVVACARHGKEALALVATTAPDVVLMDLKMPVMDGTEATRRIRAAFPQVRVLVLTTYDAQDWVLGAIRAGAAGYLLKDLPRERLVAAVVDAARGRTPVDPAVAGTLFDAVARTVPETAGASRWEALTDRERDVLELLARGLSNADIAASLYLAEGTVRNRVSAVLAKLGVSDRTQAAVLALRHGLVPPAGEGLGPEL